MALSRRDFITRSAIAGAAVFAAQKLAWAFGNSLTGVHKFIRRLPSLGLNPLPANEDGLYIPVATPASRTFQVPHTHRTYSADYYRMEMGSYSQSLHHDLPAARFLGYADVTSGKAPDHKYLGGFIIAKKDRPVQLTFVNKLPDTHPLPVDPSILGAAGPGYGAPNRAAVHFHGGDVPWVSDGGPYAWFGTKTDWRTGSSFLSNSIPGASGLPGEAEYFYPMGQTARLGWYHDHALGLTRINAYAGLASGLLIVDNVEESLINLRVLPSLPGYLRYGIPLVIQDKTFWDPSSDPAYPGDANVGSLWYPWQYEESRWDRLAAGSLPLPPVSAVPEFFSDTMLVNGCPYPYLPVEPRHYRFRILNGSQARFYNLQLYYEDPAAAGEADLTNTKVGMPPRMIQVGTEGGFLRFPAVLNNPPAALAFDQTGNALTNPNFGNAVRYNLLLGPAERADIVIDFSKCPVGSNLVLANDAPAPFPGGADTNDYFTGGPIGDTGATTAAGMGPNTRTIMQFRVSPFNTLGQGYKADPATLSLLEQLALNRSTQPCPLPPVESFSLKALRGRVKERWLSLNEDWDEQGRLMQRLGTLTSVGPARDPGAPGGQWLGMMYEDTPTEVTHEGDVEIWHIVNTTADTHPMHFHLVNVQILERQWFDAAHFVPGHPPVLVGAPRQPDANERGWKETVRMNPGEVTTIVMRFTLPDVPFTVPNSPRLATFGINGAEYVWHCHILEHEEHDMMRPLVVIPKVC